MQIWQELKKKHFSQTKNLRWRQIGATLYDSISKNPKNPLVCPKIPKKGIGPQSIPILFGWDWKPEEIQKSIR